MQLAYPLHQMSKSDYFGQQDRYSFGSYAYKAIVVCILSTTIALHHLLSTPGKMVHRRRDRGVSCIMSLQRELKLIYRRS